MIDIVSEWYETKKNIDEMNHWENQKLKKWEQHVANYFPCGTKILDVGCGLGREAFALTDMGFDVVGIDVSHEVINQVLALSAQKGYDIPFITYDGHGFPFDAASFNVVIMGSNIWLDIWR